jgi:hypothetical protein
MGGALCSVAIAFWWRRSSLEEKSGRSIGSKNKHSAVTVAIYRRFVKTLASQKSTMMFGNKREEAEAFL